MQFSIWHLLPNTTTVQRDIMINDYQYVDVDFIPTSLVRLYSSSSSAPQPQKLLGNPFICLNWLSEKDVIPPIKPWRRRSTRRIRKWEVSVIMRIIGLTEAQAELIRSLRKNGK